jgi:hypothetical protein
MPSLILFDLITLIIFEGEQELRRVSLIYFETISGDTVNEKIMPFLILLQGWVTFMLKINLYLKHNYISYISSYFTLFFSVSLGQSSSFYFHQPHKFSKVTGHILNKKNSMV